jgi:hypothetical protein
MALEHGMIEPFEDRQVRKGVVSYGVSSYGYDCRVGNEFKVFTNVYNTVVDPKNFDPQSFVDIKADECIVPGSAFAGSVAPIRSRHFLIAPSASRHITTHGPDDMKSVRPPKNGRAL